MKFRKVSRVTLFVFFLCVVFLYQGWSQPEWKIPKSIKDKYGTDLEKVKDELWKDLGKLGVLLKYHHKLSEWDRIGKLLAKHGTVFYLDDGSIISGSEDIQELFASHPDTVVNVQPKIKIGFLDFQGHVDGEEVDIVAIVSFEISFDPKTEKKQQSQDPPGTLTLFHRKVCTWR